MKLAQLIEMTTKDLNVTFKNDHIDLVYGRKRVTIYSIDKEGDEYVFNSTKYWDAPSLTVKADSPKAAYKLVRDNLEQKVFQLFGGASKPAENVSKKLGILG